MFRTVLVFAATAALLIAQSAAERQDLQSHAARANQYLESKRPDLAIAEFRAILAREPGNVDARGNLAVLEYFNGDYAKATEDFRSALTINPALWKLQALLGMSERRTGDNPGARSDLEKAFPHLTEVKFRVDAGLALIEADYAAGELGKAAEIANVLRDLDPANPDVIYAAHRIYSDLSDETLLSLAMAASNSARMHQIMAHELARQAKDEEAIAQYREALKLDPARSDIHYELAEILYTQSAKAAKDEAEQEFKIALSGNPFDAKSMCRLAEIALRKSDSRTATDYYSMALQLQPDHAGANLGMAKLYMAIHEPANAQKLLERAVRIEPFGPATRYCLSVVYGEVGRDEDSRRELAEFEKLKSMKKELSEIYQRMRLASAGDGSGDANENQ